VVQPLTKLTKKLVLFCCGPDETRHIAEIQIVFTTVPILANFDYKKEMFLESDSSSYESTDVLSLYDDQGVLYPIAFFSK
jgi:hypothetical protein